MTAKPRATLDAIAQAVGVSKATLYRFCRTRDQLIDMLITHTGVLMRKALADASLETATPQEALSRLIRNHVEEREYFIFLAAHWRPELVENPLPDNIWIQYEQALDAFFLRGQAEGFFRIDIGAAAMCDIFTGILLGIFEAERRGRVARVGLASLIEQALLQGVSKR